MTANGRFDRLPPRRNDFPPAQTDRPDADGKRALFTPVAAPAPALGAVQMECFGCGEHSVLSLTQAVRASLPGLHLPVLRRGAPSTRSYMRCPACGRRRWVSLTVHV